MRHFSMFSALFLTIFYIFPTLALTGGKAWVNFYGDCPNQIIEIEELALLLSNSDQSSSDRTSKGAASPTNFISRSSSSSIPSPSSSFHSRNISASVRPSHPHPATPSSTSSILSKRSQFRSSIAARDTEKPFIRSPAVNITQGQCQMVPIMTTQQIDSRSVIVEAELDNISPFQECNITVHEVAACIDEPLVVAPVRHRRAESQCVERNFVAWSDVWIRLDCAEVGTGMRPLGSRVDRMRPVRKVF